MAFFLSFDCLISSEICIDGFAVMSNARALKYCSLVFFIASVAALNVLIAGRLKSELLFVTNILFALIPEKNELLSELSRLMFVLCEFSIRFKTRDSRSDL